MPAAALLVALVAAQTRTFFTLPASNGHTTVLADTRSATVNTFRERPPATEEFELDGAGNVVFENGQPKVIRTRNLLFDAYFGVRVNGAQRWLRELVPTSSGYEGGVITWVQTFSGLTLTTYLFAPRALEHAGYVALLHVEGAGATSAFALHNFHLGFGRPTPGVNGETVVVAANRDVLERAFAGVVVTRPLGAVQHALAWNPSSPAGNNGYQLVQTGSGDYPDSSGDLGVADDWASAYQFGVSGADVWLGVAVAHHGDPFAGATVQGWLDAYVGTKTPQQLLADERAHWAAFQAGLNLPAGLGADELKVARQSAVMLAMAQVREGSAYLREHLTRDGEVRRSRFSTTLPVTVNHRGRGAVLASLPPGEWTYAWVRDGAYAIAGMASVGMTAEARDATRFLLDADTLPSLTRYLGFGLPEQDYNDFGPNVEYDGYGLTLWAMAKAGVDDDVKARLIADEIVRLIEPATGLMKKDSSIWETHVMGRERTWTYTNITAVRGLCDAWAMTGETRYRDAALALRANIAAKLTDPSGALASNREELQAGRGYADAAVLDAFELGLFRSDGRIARATLALLDAQLKTASGPGWSRNDDRTDTNNLSPWGSEYDSAEWVITDLRGSRLKPATRAHTTAQAAANVGLIPETYDENTGAWKFNAPMIGFGAGAYLLALAAPEAPACGAYYDEGGVDAGSEPVDAGTSMPPTPTAPKGCGCSSSPLAGAIVLALLSPKRRKTRPRTP
ncbi:MAG: glycosyl hydrolase [Myxococcaceae bacterium]|nr:glycosyl hydrolase [Myxococcaceae bacterium]